MARGLRWQIEHSDAPADTGGRVVGGKRLGKAVDEGARNGGTRGTGRAGGKTVGHGAVPAEVSLELEPTHEQHQDAGASEPV